MINVNGVRIAIQGPEFFLMSPMIIYGVENCWRLVYYLSESTYQANLTFFEQWGKTSTGILIGFVVLSQLKIFVHFVL